MPTAYRYLILNKDGYVLMTDLEGTRLEDATEMARAALAADPGTVEIEGGGSGLTYAAFPLKGGGACALVSEDLPQWVSRDLAGLLPNPQNLMLVGAAAGSALALALVARRASRVISRKMAPLAEAADVCEQHDFELRRVDQSRHVMIVAADLHLANRPTATGDLRQFAEGFIAETTAFASAQSVPTYLMVLGDMTWDEFWYSNLYSLSNYRTTMQGYPVPIYHTMGNHDNDPYFAGDFAAEAAYRKALGPTYYSFDVGEVHYVMLDNTVYINTGGTEGSMGKRNYHSYVTDQQLAWLRDDLAALRDKSQPVVVGMHCPAMNNYNAAFENRESFNPAGKTQELFDCFEGFSDVHFLTGHTHYNANMERGAIFEHNVAAVCETWWWAGKLSGVGVCKDGSPAGYAVYEADGRELNWYYKGVGQDRDKQFRTYDMNKVREFYTPAVIEILSQWPRRADDGAGDDYFDVADNTVFINVWNWDSQWTLRVTENGRELPVERVWHRDPLHTICLDYARILNGLDPVNDWESLRHSHMFRVVASSPRTSLHVEATDRFGRRYEETMRRPKEFTADMN